MSYFREPKTKHLMIEKSNVDPDALEYGVKPLVRGKIPNSWDDRLQSNWKNKGWKNQSKRKSQWRG
jgi:hypothetical protein